MLVSRLHKGPHEVPGVSVAFTVYGRDMRVEVNGNSAHGDLVSKAELPDAVHDSGAGVLGYDPDLAVVSVGFDFVVHPDFLRAAWFVATS